MSQSSAVASELRSENMNNMGTSSRRSMVSNDNEEGNNKSTAPSVHSSDDTVVRRGDGKFKKKDPTRIAHGGRMNNKNHAYNISSLFRGGRSRNTSARTAQPTIQEENDGVTCGCNWFRRWTRKDELRWVWCLSWLRFIASSFVRTIQTDVDLFLTSRIRVNITLEWYQVTVLDIILQINHLFSVWDTRISVQCNAERMVGRDDFFCENVYSTQCLQIILNM